MTKISRFIDDHPNYKSYSSDEYVVEKVPQEMVDKMCGIILRFCHQERLNLKSICDSAASYVPEAPTGNWGYDYLKNDLRDHLWSLHKKLPNFMDFLAELINELPEIEEPIEESFQECNFGYCIGSEELSTNYHWGLKQEISDISGPITDAIAATEDICHATCERLSLTLKKLPETNTLIGRKDAIREALHALEGFLKSITNTKDIKEADRVLRESPEKWGADKKIIGDGISIWNRFHEKHPDIRHGNPEVSEISYEEAVYWIQRISLYVSYLAKHV